MVAIDVTHGLDYRRCVAKAQGAPPPLKHVS
jgi:hypothetical protein